MFAGLNRDTRGERPFQEVHSVVPKEQAIEAHGIGSGVQNLDPRIGVAETVARATECCWASPR